MGYTGVWVTFVVALGTSLERYAKAHANVVRTPHIGGATLDGLQRAEAFVVTKQLRDFGLDNPT